MHKHFHKEFGLLLKQHRNCSQEAAKDTTGINFYDKEKGIGGMTLFNFIAICYCMKWDATVIIKITTHMIKVYETGMAKQNGLRVKKVKKQKKAAAGKQNP
jgi:hypothetical protein